MRLFIDTMNVSGGIVGLGVDELKWPNAVRPGDELRVETEILAARRSKSRPATELFESITSQKSARRSGAIVHGQRNAARSRQLADSYFPSNFIIASG
jgi:Acyl dehydratase